MKNKSSHTPTTQNSKFKQFASSPFFFTAIVFIVVAAILAVFSVYKYWDATKESTTIMNLSSIVPSYVKNEIERQVYQNMVANSKNYQDNHSVINAHVRSNTLSAGTKDDGEGYGTFIIDIEKLEQNYRIYYQYRDKNNFEVKVTCVEAENSYYPASSCKTVDDKTNYDAYSTLDQLLPYIGTTASGQQIYVGKSLRYAYTNQPYLQVDVNTCNNEQLLAEGLEVFKTYLISQNLDPEDFTFEPRHQCYLQY